MNSNWEDLNWSQIEDTIFNTQKGIYEARMRVDIPMVRNLQLMLINTYEAKLLSVKRITQTNSGKNMSGVYNWLSIDNNDRYAMANQLVIDGNVLPIRRVYIPKAGKKDLRSLGIPTIFDRCKQYLVKLALEPEWEAIFDATDSNSFGFRPCRSAIDAVYTVRNYMLFSNSSLWVYSAGISKCFNKVNHKALLHQVDMFEPVQTQIKMWLEAGIFEEGMTFPSSEGMSQGGVISPLLANIALYGMHYYVNQGLEGIFGSSSLREYLFVRYVDDIILLSKHNHIILKAHELCTQFLSFYSLEINEKKSRIIQTTFTNTEGKIGNIPFDFLGFRFTQRYVSKHKEFRFKSGFKTKYLTSILPAPDRIQQHKASLSTLMSRVGNIKTLIKLLNPRIEGWSNYFRHSDSKVGTDLPRKLDLWMNSKVRKFIRRTTKRRGKAPEFWKQDSKDWILFAREIDEKSGREVEIILKKYTSYKWSISKYQVLPKEFSPFKLVTLRGYRR